MLSASEMSPSLTFKRVGDFLEILRGRGLNKKAALYETVLNVECFIHEIDDPLNLTVGEMMELLEKPDEPITPPIPAGWDNFTWGRSALE